MTFWEGFRPDFVLFGGTLKGTQAGALESS